jgi:transcriptional regulator with XRE-family HTH domain
MSDLMDLKIGKVLKQFMDNDRHTLASMSKATGIPKSTLSEWLNNRSPNPSQAVKVANHLGISLHFLLFGKDDAQEPIQRILKEDFFQGTFEISIKRVKIGGEL